MSPREGLHYRLLFNMTIEQLTKKINCIKEIQAKNGNSVAMVCIVEKVKDKWRGRVSCCPECEFENGKFSKGVEYVEFVADSMADAELQLSKLSGCTTPKGRRLIIDDRATILIDDIAEVV